MRVLDVSSGHRGSQAEIGRLFAVPGEPINLDIRRLMGNGMRPHVQGDSRALPFGDETFDFVFFDPPFSFHGGRSQGGQDYRRFYTTYGLDLYHSRAELGDYIERTFREVHRVLQRWGLCIFKWSESRIRLDFPLSLKGDLTVVRRYERPSKHWGTKTGTSTWYVTLVKGPPVAEGRR